MSSLGVDFDSLFLKPTGGKSSREPAEMILGGGGMGDPAGGVYRLGRTGFWLLG